MATMVEKTRLLRQLVPKSYHFDGYSEVNCPNPRDQPFFADNVIPMGEHYLITRLVDDETLSVEFSTSCQIGLATFEPYLLSISDFAKKIQEATRNNRDCIFLEIQTNYQLSCVCDKTKCSYSNKDCSYLITEHPTKVCAAVSFNFAEMKKALTVYFEITTSENGGIAMASKRKNKFFGLNLEFGLCKNPNIASTLMGIAVRNTSNGNWYVFDPNTQTRKNIAHIKMGNFPMCLVPTNKLVIGKLYKIDDGFYYVKALNPNGTVTLIGGADGIIREQIPEEGLIAGMNFYTEVVAFDATTMMNPSTGENVGGNLLAALCMMQWSKGGDKAEFSLDDINDDSFNGLGAYLPLLMASGNGMTNLFGNGDSQSNFAMLMALSNEDSDSSELMQMMVLNQFMNGNSGNNLFAGGNIFPTSQTPTPVSVNAGNVICKSCAGTYPAGTNFCPKCGGKTRALSSTCFKCGTILMTGASFCHKCGAKAGIPVCSGCGLTLNAETRFCPRCGLPVNPTETPVTVAPPVQTIVAPPLGVRAPIVNVPDVPAVPETPIVPDTTADI